MDIFVQDWKLNLSPYYLKPGFAYGGSCLPKEVRAVRHIAQGLGADLPMIAALTVSNQEHIRTALAMVRETGARSVGVLGLAFKPGTDDLRESPILEVIAALHAEGVAVTIHDPAITRATEITDQLAYVRHGASGLKALASALPGLLRDSCDMAVEGTEALVITHKTPAYCAAAAAATARGIPVIDLVRLFDDLPLAETYHGIGW